MLASFENSTLFYEAMKSNIVIDLAREDDNKPPFQPL